MKRMNRIARSQNGQSIVEFAVLLPVLLVMLLGMIEWGFVLWAQTSYVNAARDGARAAVVRRDWSVNQVVRTTEIKSIVSDRLRALPTILKQNIADRINVQLIPDAANTTSIRVSIANQPYRAVLGIGLVPVPATLSASAEFRYEGQL